MKILDIKDLVKKYKTSIAVDHLNLEIHEGEILGLLGPNGCGKTTTIDCLLSLLKYESGTIKIFEKTMHPNALDIKRDIGYVPQDVAVFQELTVFENVDYFCGLYISNPQVRHKLVLDALQFVSLEAFQKKRPAQLSGGLLRRLNIACGIAHKPRFIIFDEPTVAVDPQSRNKILEGISALNKAGITILYTSHYMEEIEQLCSRIVIMDKGCAIAQGSKDTLKAQSQYGETVSIEASNIPKAFIDTLQSQSFVAKLHYHDDTLTIHCHKNNNSLIQIMQLLNQASITYTNIHNSLPTLNDVFLEITGKALRD